MPFALLLVRFFAAYVFVALLGVVPHGLRLGYGVGAGLAGLASSTLILAVLLFSIVLMLFPRSFLLGLGFGRADADGKPGLADGFEVVCVALLGLYLLVISMRDVVVWAVTYLSIESQATYRNAASDWVAQQWPGLVGSILVALAGGILILGPGKVAGMLRALRNWRPGQEKA